MYAGYSPRSTPAPGAVPGTRPGVAGTDNFCRTREYAARRDACGAGGHAAGLRCEGRPEMQALTRFVLRHKALVALTWLLVAVAGVMTISGTTHRMTNDFSMPGQAYKVDNQIVAEYGNGGSQSPYVPVLTVPAGERVTNPAAAAEAGRVFGAIAASVPGVRVADYSSTGNARFVT